MKALSAVAIGLLLMVSILLQWVPARWPVSMLQTGVFALGMAWAVRQMLRPIRFRTNVLLLPLGGVLGWGVLQLATGKTVYAWATWNSVLIWAANFVLFFLALQIFSEQRLGERFLHGASIFGCALAVLSVLQAYTADGSIFWHFDSGYRDLVMGPFPYKNQYAAFMELLLPLALVAALTPGRLASAYAAMAGMMYASVIASASRMGFVLASMECVAVPVLFLRRVPTERGRAALLLASILGFGMILAGAAGFDALWERLRQADAYDVRRQFLHSSLDMIRERPYVGFGLGTWSTVYPAYAHFDRGKFANQAHNDWAQWLCEGGLPFAALMLWVALWTVRPAWRTIWGLGAVTVFVHCLVDYPIQRPALSACFFLWLGLLASCEKFDQSAAKIP